MSKWHCGIGVVGSMRASTVTAAASSSLALGWWRGEREDKVMEIATAWGEHGRILSCHQWLCRAIAG